MRVSRTIPALALLFVVTAGLFAMHTLGHPDAPETMRVSHGGPVSMTSDLGETMALAVEAPQDAPGMPMGSLVVCVAILCGLIVVAIIAALAARGGIRRLIATPALWPIGDAGRGPPRILIGLALANLSVLRN